jgi:hypothetical protein
VSLAGCAGQETVTHGWLNPAKSSLPASLWRGTADLLSISDFSARPLSSQSLVNNQA